MRAGGVPHLRDRQIEGAVIVGQSREAGRGDGDPMIATLARDQLFLLRLAQRVGAVPQHLDHRVIGLGAGIGEERLRHLHRRHRHQLFGQLDRRPVRAVGEIVVKGQAAHLRLGGADQPLLAKAHGNAPQAGHRLDIALAMIVIDEDAFALVDDLRPKFGMRHGICVGMEVIGDIARLGGVGSKCHRNVFPGWRGARRPRGHRAYPTHTAKERAGANGLCRPGPGGREVHRTVAWRPFAVKFDSGLLSGSATGIVRPKAWDGLICHCFLSLRCRSSARC